MTDGKHLLIEALYEAIADVMVQTIEAKQGSKTTMILPVGPVGQYPAFAVTLGPHDVLRAKRTEVVFFAGRFQRFALREVLFRRPTMHLPGTLLKLRKEPDGRLVPQDLRVWATPEEAGEVTTRTI